MIIPFNQHRTTNALIDCGCGMVEVDFTRPELVRVSAASLRPPCIAGVPAVISMSLAYRLESGRHELVCDARPLVTTQDGARPRRAEWMAIAEAVQLAAQAFIAGSERLLTLARIAALESRRAMIAEDERALSGQLDSVRSERAEIDAEIAIRRRAMVGRVA